MRQLHPELIILDLADEPELGIRLAHFLSEAAPGQRFVAVGPHLSPELLLSAMRAGVADYLPRPVTAGPSRRRSIECGPAGSRPAQDAAKAPGQLLCFYSAKGGAGTTTVATNFAIVLHGLSGKRVLIVDLDLELGEIALLLGVQPAV